MSPASTAVPTVHALRPGHAAGPREAALRPMPSGIVGRPFAPEARRDLDSDRSDGPGLAARFDRFAARAPSREVLRRRLRDAAERVADHLGVPARDVHVLGGALAVAASLFTVGLVATSSPEPGPVRQLEAQHQQWLQEQAAQAPVATVVD